MTVHVPYGYMKNPENQKEWVIDEEAAQVVKKIFTLCMNGVWTEPNCRPA